MTTQAFESENKATDDEILEVEALMKGLSFTKTRHCTDGYESWSSEVLDIDSYVELVKRARMPDA